jgi:hypothetical protein
VTASEQLAKDLKQAILDRLPFAVETTPVSGLEAAFVGQGQHTKEAFAAAMRQLVEGHDIFVHNGWVVKVRKSS